MLAKALRISPTARPRRPSFLGVFLGGSSSCPFCGSNRVCRSKTHGFFERMLKLCTVVPWRCISCGNRFFAFR